MYLGRIFSTVVVLGVSWFIHAMLAPALTVMTAEQAGRQFENSTEAYLQTTYFYSSLHVINWLIAVAVAFTLIGIWYKPVRRAVNAMTGGEPPKESRYGDRRFYDGAFFVAAIIPVAAMLALTNPAQAFFEKTDRTEIVPIFPNESAFWIPNQGDVKGKQVQMESVEYLNANKIAARNFQIPHAKLTGSAGASIFSGWDYYVPTGRLIKVDRTPFSREWVDATDRGTSMQKEGFPCQTQEGLNITVGVSIGTSVAEADAAKFLYRFGVKPPPGQLSNDGRAIDNDGNIIFASVWHGRSLREVMDDVGRKYVQTLACGQIAKRTFIVANKESVEIMESIKADATKYFATVGITLDFIGWGDSFEFDKPVQEAVNRLFIAQQDEAIAKMLAPHKETIAALAQAEATRGWGAKADGKFPTTVVGAPPNLRQLLNDLFGITPTGP